RGSTMDCCNYSGRPLGRRRAQATLTSWRDNQDRFAAVARGNPQLEAALPISADVAALAGTGLDAVAAVESGRAPSTDWRERAKELLDRQAAAQKGLGEHHPGGNHGAAAGRPSDQHHAGRPQARGSCVESWTINTRSAAQTGRRRSTGLP